MKMIFAAVGILVGALAAGFLVFELLAQRDARQRKALLRARVTGQGNESATPGHLAQERFTKLPFIGQVILRSRQTRRQTTLEYELPQMLEIIALGLQAGMGFDQAFGLYVQRFDTELARQCQPYHDVWLHGLRSREEGMQELAQALGFTSFQRFTAITLRAIKFGAPLTDVLLQLAADTRKECNAAMQERIAKAPVKMLIPTSTLILPAMMILVLGPMILDLVRQMG